MMDVDDMDTSTQAVPASALGQSMDHDETKTMDADMTEDNGPDDLPDFPALTPEQVGNGKDQFMRVGVPAHRLTPLKQHWMDLYTPVVQHMKLDIRYNVKRKCVELKTNQFTESAASLQKAADFIKAFTMGFEIRDAIALLRMDDLFIDTFEIKDVKSLHGDHLSRAIGRIAGIGGKTKYTIENSTRTRIVLADTHVHILGSYKNINAAKDAVVRLILGAPPGTVYTQMRAVANRMKERF